MGNIAPSSIGPKSSCLQSRDGSGRSGRGVELGVQVSGELEHDVHATQWPPGRVSASLLSLGRLTSTFPYGIEAIDIVTFTGGAIAVLADIRASCYNI